MKKSTSSVPAVHCSFKKMVPIEELKPNPRNPNKHSEIQLKALSKVISAQGWRSPIVVSNRSGFIVKGHGRLLAAKLAELKEAPVDFQDYETDAAEIADMIADNRLSELADVSMSELKDLLQEIDTGDIDMTLTGYTDQELELMMTAVFQEGLNDVRKEYEGMPEYSENLANGIKLLVHFKSTAERDLFATLIDQQINEKTRFIWFPKLEAESIKDYKVTSES